MRVREYLVFIVIFPKPMEAFLSHLSCPPYILVVCLLRIRSLSLYIQVMPFISFFHPWQSVTLYHFSVHINPWYNVYS